MSTDKQLNSVDGIRAQFDPGSPLGMAYINSFYEHSEELVNIFRLNPGILARWDDLMNELSTGAAGEAVIDRMKVVLDEVRQPASDSLKKMIDKHKFEMDYFPGPMAFMLFSFYFF